MNIKYIYKPYYLGEFRPSWETDDEQTSYEKYRLLYYYYETEEHDRLYLGEKGMPRNGKELAIINRFASVARKKVISWKHKKEFCFLEHEDIKERIKIYEEKYPHFKTI
jgi:hypothetical protein